MSTLDPWQILESRAWEEPSVWGSWSDTATNVTERFNGKEAALFIIFLCWGPQNTTNGHIIPVEGVIYTTNLPTKHIAIWIVFFTPKEALSNNNSSDNAGSSCSVVSDSLRVCSLPSSSVHGILQARILQSVAMPSSRGSYQPRDQTHVSHIAGRFFTVWATREAQEYWSG